MAQNSSVFSDLIANGEFRVDEEGHALLNGQFLLMIPPPVILHLQNRLKEEVGQEQMEDIMIDAGQYQVQQALDRYRDRYGIDDISREKLFSYFNNIVKILGWGEIEMQVTQNSEAKVTVKHPTLPSVYRHRNEEMADNPICHYLRGMMSEGLSALTDDGLLFEETTCAAMGGKVCVFEKPID